MTSIPPSYEMVSVALEGAVMSLAGPGATLKAHKVKPCPRHKPFEAYIHHMEVAGGEDANWHTELPEHEFTIPGWIVADAIVNFAIKQRDGSYLVRAELVLIGE